VLLQADALDPAADPDLRLWSALVADGVDLDLPMQVVIGERATAPLPAGWRTVAAEVLVVLRFDPTPTFDELVDLGPIVLHLVRVAFGTHVSAAVMTSGHVVVRTDRSVTLQSRMSYLRSMIGLDADLARTTTTVTVEPAPVATPVSAHDVFERWSAALRG
jgi:hypothetical protein